MNHTPDVSCPTCNAAPLERCRTCTGRPASAPHTLRAWEASQEGQAAWTTSEQDTPAETTIETPIGPIITDTDTDPDVVHQALMVLSGTQAARTMLTRILADDTVQHQHRISALAADVHAATLALDDAIRAADAAGISKRAIATAAGVTRQAIQQRLRTTTPANPHQPTLIP